MVKNKKHLSSQVSTKMNEEQIINLLVLTLTRVARACQHSKEYQIGNDVIVNDELQADLLRKALAITVKLRPTDRLVTLIKK